ncbi:hypothetical protein, partial [Cronobacter sakazakii]|uniref:hypothetical protein n=1 Tax=Cronobacter sakazakii TaxID=28141 RepID=UPI00294AF279
RRAHNPKVVGSNPAPATNKMNTLTGVFLCLQFSIPFDCLLRPVKKARYPRLASVPPSAK